MKLTTLTSSFLFLFMISTSATAAYAQNTETPAYQFKTDAPIDNHDQKYEFKTDTPEAASTQNANQDLTSDANTVDKNGELPFSFSSYIGYPKHNVYFNYQPTFFTGKFTYRGVGFDYSNLSLITAEFGYRLEFSPRWMTSLALRLFDASTESGTPGSFAVTASSVSMSTAQARINYCFFGSSFFTKFCPGIVVGNDMYPVLAFTSSTNMTLKKVSELSAGINLIITNPLIYTSTLLTDMGVLVGTGTGGAAELTSKSNTLFYITSTALWPMSPTLDVMVGARAEMRSATVQGLVGTNTDTWDTSLAAFGGNLGVNWKF